MTYNNCPIAKFNEGTSWPVQAGHPCMGCSRTSGTSCLHFTEAI
ncbi:MAG: hypothetical protein R2860_15735 [Desulfobacterales bacterium]